MLQAGTKENIIPDEVVIKLNVRTFDAGVRKHVLVAIERIVNAEARAAGKLNELPVNMPIRADMTGRNPKPIAFRAPIRAKTRRNRTLERLEFTNLRGPQPRK